MQGCTVAVIGGGPAGVLTAAHFARRGARVTVYERRTAEEQEAPSRGWSIAIGDVATASIEHAGLSNDFGPGGIAEGFTAFSGLKPPRYIGAFSKGSQPRATSHTLTRAWIIRHLREQCKTHFPTLVEFQDGCSLVGGNLPKGEVIVAQGGAAEEGAEVKAQVDIVVAADGAGSKARRLLQELDPTLKVDRQFVPVSTRAFSLGTNGMDPAKYATLETPSGQAFHLVPKDHGKRVKGGVSAFSIPVKGSCPHLVFFIVGCRKGGADVNGSLTASPEWWNEKRAIEETQKLLEDALPQVPRAWLRKCAEACAIEDDRETIRTSFVECNKLGTGRCVLIGDAAHSVSANLGYGATAGMHDAAILSTTAAALYTMHAGGTSSEGPGSTFDRIAEEWTHERLPDAHAYTRLSKAVSDVSLFKHHKSWLRLLAGLPLAVPHMMGRMQFRGKSWIAPPPEASSTAIINGGMKPRDVTQAFNDSFNKLLALFAVLMGIVLGLVLSYL